MTYLVKTSPRVVVTKRKPALSDWFEDIMNKMSGQPSGEQQCIDAANVTFAPFDAKIADLVQTWTTTGFYLPADIRQGVAATMTTIQQAQAAIDQAAQTSGASQDSIMRATDDLARAGSRSLDYLAAATAADQQGIRTVNAPGFKRWVTDSMAAASSAMVTAQVIGCIQPWWVTALGSFQTAFDSLYALAKQLVGAVLAIGETALKVAAGLPQFSDVILYGGVALGAWYLWNKLGGRR